MPGIFGDHTDRQAFARIGSADEVAERLVTLAQETGVNHVVMSVQWPGMPQGLVLDTMCRLGEEVFPKVRAALGVA